MQSRRRRQCVQRRGGGCCRGGGGESDGEAVRSLGPPCGRLMVLGDVSGRSALYNDKRSVRMKRLSTTPYTIPSLLSPTHLPLVIFLHLSSFLTPLLASLCKVILLLCSASNIFQFFITVSLSHYNFQFESRRLSKIIKDFLT